MVCGGGPMAAGDTIVSSIPRRVALPMSPRAANTQWLPTGGNAERERNAHRGAMGSRAWGTASGTVKARAFLWGVPGGVWRPVAVRIGRWPWLAMVV